MRLADKSVQLSRVDTQSRFRDILEALPPVPKSVNITKSTYRPLTLYPA